MTSIVCAKLMHFKRHLKSDYIKTIFSKTTLQPVNDGHYKNISIGPRIHENSSL